MLLLSAEHLRKLGTLIPPDRILQEADLLEQSISTETR